MNIIYLLLPVLAYSFNNMPIHLFSKNINNINNIKIIEPISIKNKETPAFVFFTGLSGKIPSEIYNNFINNIASSGVSCFIFNEDIYKSKNVIDYINNNYANVTISGHSSGASKALKLYSECNNIDNIILFDPVDDRIFNNNKLEFIYNNFFNKFQNKFEISNIKNYLLVRAENSYKWSLFPPRIPFIPLFDIDDKILNINDNTYIINDVVDEIIDENDESIKITKTISRKINTNKKVIKIRDYGHMDILDDYWSKLMFSFLKGSDKDKTITELSNYHKFNAFLVNRMCFNKLDNIKDELKNIEFNNIKYKINDI